MNNSIYALRTMERRISIILCSVCLLFPALRSATAQQYDQAFREQAMKMAFAFTENPQLAEDVIGSLTNRESLAKKPVIGDVIKQHPNDFQESALLTSLSKVQQRLSVDSLTKLASYSSRVAAQDISKTEERQTDLRVATRALGEILARAKQTTNANVSATSVNEILPPSARQPFANHCELLQAIATNSLENVDLRRIAIRDLAVLNVHDGILDLRACFKIPLGQCLSKGVCEAVGCKTKRIRPI